MEESGLPKQQPNNPLHGITLKVILEHLYEVYGWDGLAQRIQIRCFTHDPSISSSLKFLRKTEWARKKVEELYLYSLRAGKTNKINRHK
ncbi:VF530 family DNA-binding protein [Lunatimonas salinarum]|uniref:VF530 family protein n=1 Tax=Lunatimonas salinarum TaxID=1774590 RepID=UPI001ADFF914|nr:VF530 family protein [Lunatimonas salinarum]